MRSWRSWLNPVFYPVRCGLLLFFLGCLLIAARFFSFLLVPAAPAGTSGQETVRLTIPRGLTSREIALLLHEHGLVANPRVFALYASLTGSDRRLQSGVYVLKKSWSPREVLSALRRGETLSYRVTIPEGATLDEIASILARKGVVPEEEFRAALAEDYPYPFLRGLPPGPRRLEGFLFPATYEFRAGASGREVVAAMLERFERAFTPELRRRAEELGLSVREVVILASLVEEEAKLDSERPLVAAVFLNRLRRGMRLESCATVQYALGKRKEKLSYTDLKVASPYNTYLHPGLPPGPIASPGLASIKAVLYPAPGDYLYFVARGDGSHYFSRSFREHEEAARRYQR